MSLHHKRGHSTKEDNLIKTPNELINMLIADADKRTWVTEQLLFEGPKPKQILSALLLSRLYELVKTIEVSSKVTFQLQDGYEVLKETDGYELRLPILMPVNLGPDIDKQKITDIISLTPAHETLANIFCLQVIEWAITVNGNL